MFQNLSFQDARSYDSIVSGGRSDEKFEVSLLQDLHFMLLEQIKICVRVSLDGLQSCISIAALGVER